MILSMAATRASVVLASATALASAGAADLAGPAKALAPAGADTAVRPNGTTMASATTPDAIRLIPIIPQVVHCAIAEQHGVTRIRLSPADNPKFSDAADRQRAICT